MSVRVWNSVSVLGPEVTFEPVGNLRWWGQQHTDRLTTKHGMLMCLRIMVIGGGVYTAHTFTEEKLPFSAIGDSSCSPESDASSLFGPKRTQWEKDIPFDRNWEEALRKFPTVHSWRSSIQHTRFHLRLSSRSHFVGLLHIMNRWHLILYSCITCSCKWIIALDEAYAPVWGKDSFL